MRTTRIGFAVVVALGVDAVVFGIAVLEAVPFQGVFAGLVA